VITCLNMTNLSKGEPHTLTCIMTPDYALERAVKGWRVGAFDGRAAAR
jgi:hypothetical protein